MQVSFIVCIPKRPKPIVIPSYMIRNTYAQPQLYMCRRVCRYIACTEALLHSLATEKTACIPITAMEFYKSSVEY